MTLPPNTQVQTASPDRVYQIGEIAKFCGLPANAPTADVIAALERKAATTRDQAALWTTIGKLIAIPSNLNGSPLAFVTDAIRMIANRAADAKTALVGAITSGRLRPDDAPSHARWLHAIVNGQNPCEFIALLNSASAAVASVPRFKALVAAEVAAGNSKSEAVDVARAADPQGHHDWLAAGGGTL